MFTGLIQEVGRIRHRSAQGEGVRFSIACSLASRGLQPGESIAINGVCLTVESFDTSSFSAFASQETLRRSTLGRAAEGDSVNIERAMALGDRMGGHLVTGHVDGVGRLETIEQKGESRIVTISAPPPIMRLIIEKGSIAVDGISLTIASLTQDSFSAWIIPETWRATSLRLKSQGAFVNLEGDMIGKYVYRFLEIQSAGRENSSAGSLGGETGEPDSGASSSPSRGASLLDALQKGGWSGRGGNLE